MAELPPMALDDVRVIDMTDEHGMYCGKLLATLGADVIKIESPSGDSARRIGPFYRDDPNLENSLFFLYMNTDKRGMTLNLDSDAGVAILQRLIDTADIVLQTQDGGWLRDRGIDEASLRAKRPKLIVTSITPFGRTAPYRDHVASDLTIMGMGGALYDYGFPDKPPNRLPGHQATILSGIHAAVATAIALYARDLRGVGQHVDVSMQDAIATASITAVLTYDRRGAVTGRVGLQRMYPGMGLYECADGYSYWVCGGRHWETLIGWMGEVGMSEDLGEPGWRDTFDQMTNLRTTLALLGADAETRAQAMARYAHVEDVFSRFVRALTRREVVEGALRYRVPALPLQTATEVADDPHLEERAYWVTLQAPTGDRIRYPGPPFRLYLSPTAMRRAAPQLGEHTVDVLQRDLGMSREEITRLLEAGTL